MYGDRNFFSKIFMGPKLRISVDQLVKIDKL